MSTPKRIQLRRTKGWRKPEGAIVVARPSRWGNPYHVEGEIVTHPNGNDWWSPTEARGVAVRLYREDLYSGRLPYTVDVVCQELTGHDLACWCPLDQPCHADVLLALANPEAKP